MVSGALSLKTKMAGEVMTRLEDVFMLHKTTLLDFDTVSLIQKRGYSRIPVYDGERKNIVALFHTKDLAFVDPNDKMPIKTLIDFYHHQLIFTEDWTTLDEVLINFKAGKSHLAFVQHHYNTNEEDPYYEVTGVVTLEDVIEEILQDEIVDETDILTDNRMKHRRKNSRQDFSDFSKIGQGQDCISPQMALAAFQFLSASVDPFNRDLISSSVLRRLLAQKIYVTHRVANDEDGQLDRARIPPLYTESVAADYFVIIIEGRVKVTVGREKLVFVSGPFTTFGVEAIKVTDEGGYQQQQFVPDYSVEVIETTMFIKIARSVYMEAYKESLVEKIDRERGNMETETRLESAGKELATIIDVESGYQSPDGSGKSVCTSETQDMQDIQDDIELRNRPNGNKPRRY